MQFKFLCCPCSYLLKGELHMQSEVSSFEAWLFVTTSKTAPESAESATTAKEIAKHRENVVHVHATSSKSVKAFTLRTIEPKLVVALTFLGIVKHIIGFGCLLEFLFCLFVTWIAVWVIFYR